MEQAAARLILLKLQRQRMHVGWSSGSDSEQNKFDQFIKKSCYDIFFSPIYGEKQKAGLYRCVLSWKMKAGSGRGLHFKKADSLTAKIFFTAARAGP